MELTTNNPVTQPSNTSKLPSKKIVILICLIILVLILATGGYFLISKQFNKISPKLQQLTKKNPIISENIPEDLQKLGVVRRVEKIPAELKKIPSKKKTAYFAKANDNIVFIDATVKEIIEPKKKYKLLLDSGEELTVVIKPETDIKIAWFGFKEGIEQPYVIRYESASPEVIERVQVDNKVHIEYFEKNFVVGKELSLIFFALLE